MKNTNKGFTLVELIVVITILAILGTIAFISLQGYSQDAKNSKVTSDLRNIASAIETDSTKNGTLLSEVLTGDKNITNGVSGDFNSGATTIANGTNYWVGNVNFGAIGQNGADFKDPNAGSDGVDYLFAYVKSNDFKGYQLVGQIIENDTKKARVTGTYYEVTASADVDGLVSENWATTQLKDKTALTGTNNLY